MEPVLFAADKSVARPALGQSHALHTCASLPQRGNGIWEGTMLRPGALVGVPLLAALALFQPPPAAAQSRPEAKDMALVGTNDLQARSAYQPTIHSQGGRWIAYIGHHGGTKEIPKPRNPLTGVDEFNGTSLIDVTDPRRPKYLGHIPGDEGLAEDGGAQMVRVCDGKSLPRGDAGAVYML